jgi:hypothetical protein
VGKNTLIVIRDNTKVVQQDLFQPSCKNKIICETENVLSWLGHILMVREYTESRLAVADQGSSTVPDAVLKAVFFRNGGWKDIGPGNMIFASSSNGGQEGGDADTQGLNWRPDGYRNKTSQFRYEETPASQWSRCIWRLEFCW